MLIRFGSCSEGTADRTRCWFRCGEMERGTEEGEQAGERERAEERDRAVRGDRTVPCWSQWTKESPLPKGRR